MAGARRLEDARLHLEVFGQPVAIDLGVHVGAGCTPLDLWEPARDIAEALTAASLAEVGKAGKSISCAAGCGACCRQLVPISALEATALLAVVERMPEERRDRIRARFADAVQQMERAGLLDPRAPPGRSALISTQTEPKAQWRDVSQRYWALQLACPLLEDESCGIYAERPMICREYHVTTPKEHCATLDPRTEAAPWPLRMSEVLAKVGGEIAGAHEGSLPFALALEWAQAHGAAFAASRDGAQMFHTMVRVIEESWEG